MEHLTRMFQRAVSVLMVLTAPSVLGQANAATVFYVVAHQDDWQFFMTPSSWSDVKTPGTKVVFVYTTAGDAGVGNGTGGRPTPYYVAREEGANRAVRFMADAGTLGGAGSWGSVIRNGKTLRRYVYKNTLSYFLRLPDGGADGAGYPTTGSQSLERLYTGAIPTITSIDGALAFSGWGDLTQTLTALIESEATGSSDVWINIQDPRPEFNVVDHPDHRYTGTAMVEAVGTLPCISKRRFLDYIIAYLPMNLSTDALIVHSAVWGVTSSGLSDSYSLNLFGTVEDSWLGRSYFQVETGSACSF